MTQTTQRRINLKVSPELHRRLRIEAARSETTLTALLSRWIEERLSEPPRPPDPQWREHFRSAMARMPGPDAKMLSPEEIESEITRAREEVRELRRAGRG